VACTPKGSAAGPDHEERPTPSAQVRSDIDGVVIHFEADTDDELWQKFGDHFRGRWEDEYYSIDDYLENHGLVLDPND